MSRSVLDLARGGDERAFGELVGPHRRELRAHCYRMLGSLTDAEDLLQETLTAAWRGLAAFEGRSSVRTWLYRIATNRCLNAIRDGHRRVPPAEPVPPFVPPEPSSRGDVTWLQPFPDALLDGAPGPAARYELRESVELAFVAAVQRLPPRQAAILLLCDVLGYSAGEAADMLATTGTAAKGLLQRARSAVGPPRETLSADSAEERELARRFAAAFSADDVDGVVALLTDDAWLSMPPAPHEYVGRAAVAGFLRARTACGHLARFELVPTRANGAPAFGCFLGGKPAGLIVLGVSDGGIDRVAHFLVMDLPTDFGLSR
ncbi:RNA polymerase subunit sigma-70 [Phytomonospora endophytica]|uniref:RNA polymerase sigma-70 factor (ECF subfamily) n=1 Tax=Phytomonospora endophytica TaxID=714109 RepID=A0A841FIT6_9ACTN|nr:RNA polymerase subunit sigma-70 [Phytomonospora endophytica]MBB6033057.1 RNA polymerase sigma-70 factor (ECF subfamily) [Phytomonospora endophytica]GIG65284.1 RNA polymerase sigma factor [Phytomonospora endophytica]